jgi:hypothetical protein
VIQTKADAVDKTLLGAFAWPLLVPSSTRRSHTDLLKEAANLASRDEIRNYRRAFYHWWMMLPLDTTPDQAAKNLEGVIKGYAAALRRTRIRTRMRQAVLVLAGGAAASVGALTQEVLPSALAGAGSVGIGEFLAAWTLKTSVPSYLFPGALFHQARARLDWQ